MIPYKVKRRMKKIILPAKAYYMKSESALRFCHIRNKEYKYVVIPFCDFSMLMTAAKILKDSDVINTYKVIKNSNNQYTIELARFDKAKVHKDEKGFRLSYQAKHTIAWSELQINRSKAKQFIARLELLATEAPIIPIFPKQHSITKTAA
jgi:uncharacterized protein YegP (UPF0339 family)